jgi:hypothetical protein
MKIIEYKTAQGSSRKELDESVNRLIQDGYQPFGSPYLSDNEVEGKVDTSTRLPCGRPWCDTTIHTAHKPQMSELPVPAGHCSDFT